GQKTTAVTARSAPFHSVRRAPSRAFSPVLSFFFSLSLLPFFLRPSLRFVSFAPVRPVFLVWPSSLSLSCASSPCPFSIRFNKQTSKFQATEALRLASSTSGSGVGPPVAQSSNSTV